MPHRLNCDATAALPCPVACAHARAWDAEDDALRVLTLDVNNLAFCRCIRMVSWHLAIAMAIQSSTRSRICSPYCSSSLDLCFMTEILKIEDPFSSTLSTFRMSLSRSSHISSSTTAYQVLTHRSSISPQSVYGVSVTHVLYRLKQVICLPISRLSRYFHGVGYDTIHTPASGSSHESVGSRCTFRVRR